MARRKDIFIEDDLAVCKAIENAVESLRAYDMAGELNRSPKARIRESLIESDASDPNGFERVLGKSDLVSVNFFARGLKASRAVCRIKVPAPDGGWYGTGFLAGPGLLVTNNHVLNSPDDAAQAEAEFGYEHDVEGVLQPPIQFNLAPHEVFFTDIDHDITFVAVTPFSEGGVPLERYGYLPFLPLSGKGLHGERVTIAQHPGGKPKQLAVRASQIVDLSGVDNLGINTERFIHYTTDTKPGSSGAPVLNDQWQVVAVHHKAIPKPEGTKEKLDFDGGEPEWIANEGIRVSAISRLLETKRFSNINVAGVLERLERAIGIPTSSQPESVADANPANEKDPRPHKAEKWKGWHKARALGYDPKFLPIELQLLDILGDKKGEAAPLIGTSDVILDYLHFSTVIDRRRKFPLITAVNIRGDKLIHPGSRSGRFRRDIRIDEKFQPAANFYEKKLGNDPVQFSRGHLVRRFDPCWGETKDDAKTAEGHTFHYTNAAPQVQGFNAGDWLDIEDYVLNRSQIKEKRMTVFTGPIFRDYDPIYGKDREGGGWAIPVSYWKIAVIEKADGTISATAFIQGQTKFVKALFESRVFTNLRQNTLAQLQSDQLQTTIATVEEESGLDFSALREHDSLNALESTRHMRFIFSVRDIII